MQKSAIIIGAGPAGLTAAYELLTRTDIKPVILEQSNEIGGLSRTVNYKGNRMDIGGHRFFSKSDRVMEWWLKILPIDPNQKSNLTLQYQQKQASLKIEADKNISKDADSIMLVRPRRSRIYFLKKFFPYPLSLSLSTLQKLGAIRTIKILVSYVWVKLFPRNQEDTLEDFFINRFGKELYLTFFKSYTEKVWGVPCTQLSAAWGAQRIKDLSIRQAIKHMVKQIFISKSNTGDIGQKGTSTSLIEQFLYPKLGPGQLWETVAARIVAMGGKIMYDIEVTGLQAEGEKINSVISKNKVTGEALFFKGDYFFSTMPLREMVAGIEGTAVPANAAAIAKGLQYRDFITVGLLVNKFSESALRQGPLRDNWIYIQDSTVQMGRLQIFNNWSPAMVADKNKQWLGLEYFCNITDAIWKTTDDELQKMAAMELKKIGIIETKDVIDGIVIRQEKTYPSYTGTFENFEILKNYLMHLKNLFPIGRNGMHRYNNSDHSMLTAMVAVDLIIAGDASKETIWEINTDEEYHEGKTTHL
jgi:protoporphyrinogen oxidase